MKEKLQEYALIAEIISAICIVLSLIFVGLQVRQGAEETAANTAAIRGSVRRSLMEADKDLLLFAVENPDADFQQTPPEVLFQIAYVRTRYLFWAQYEDGLMDEETYDSYMMPFLRDPGARQRLDVMGNSNIIPVRFIEEVERLSAKFKIQLQTNPSQ